MINVYYKNVSIKLGAHYSCQDFFCTSEAAAADDDDDDSRLFTKSSFLVKRVCFVALQNINME